MPTEPRGGRVLDLEESVQNAGVMAEQLEEISRQMQAMLRGRLTEQAIIVLIRAALPHGMKLSAEQIRAVLYAARDLGANYVTPREPRTPR